MNALTQPHFVSHAGGHRWQAWRDGNSLVIDSPDAARNRWQLHDTHGELTLAPVELKDPGEGACMAALDAAFALHPKRDALRLHLADQTLGSVRPWRAGGDDRAPVIARDLLWQTPTGWQSDPRPPQALRYRMTEGRRHPQRPLPPIPGDTVYRRHIPWLRRTLTLRAVDIERDLPTFSRWMNDPVVSAFWQEQGDIDQHRAYLRQIEHDPRTIGLIGCFDDDAFGYFEVYWAKEDRIAPFCDATDFDRGWHVLVGEPRYRGKPFVTAWMPSISHHLFLDDCRTQRLVIEPRADNRKMIKNLGLCGYALLKEFDFPHKRAMLGTLSRERFFSEALWHPREVI